MNFVASLAAGLPNAAVLHVRSFTKGVSHESTTYSSNPGHCFWILRSLARRAKRLRDAGLLQEARAIDGQARREKHARLLAHARAFDGKVVTALSVRSSRAGSTNVRPTGCGRDSIFNR